MVQINDGGFMKRIELAGDLIRNKKHKVSKGDQAQMQKLDQIRKKVDELDQLIAEQEQALYYGRENLLDR